MVGDCIESTSEDEEFWEKRLANNAQAPRVKRHGMLTRTESRICILCSNSQQRGQADDLVPLCKYFYVH